MYKLFQIILACAVFAFLSNNKVYAQNDMPKKKKVENTVLPMKLDSKFIPSGWMGDGKEKKKYLSFKRIPVTIKEKKQVGINIIYKNGSNWAGIYWQYPENNWGDSPGLSLLGAKRIVFYAKGESGNELLEFKSGGIAGIFGDTYESSTGKIILTKEWIEYSLNLVKHDLSNVIGAFSWNASSEDNDGYLNFYLANIIIE